MKEKKTLTIELTSKCQLNCMWCSSKYDKEYELPFKDIIKILEDGRCEGFTHVRFSGGEPTLYPDLNACIIYARRLGYYITLLTNGIIKYCNMGIDKYEIRWDSSVIRNILWLKNIMNRDVTINVVAIRESGLIEAIEFGMTYNIPIHIMKLQKSGNAKIIMNDNTLHEVDISSTGDSGCRKNDKRLILSNGTVYCCSSDKADCCSLKNEVKHGL